MWVGRRSSEMYLFYWMLLQWLGKYIIIFIKKAQNIVKHISLEKFNTFNKMPTIDIDLYDKNLMHKIWK